jgi:two-component system response regulator
MQRGILIVDDDEDDCRLVKEGLYQVGLRVPIHIAMGGAEALEFLKANRSNLPALIILDFNMPQMNGLEVLRTVHEEYGIPTVLYSTTCTPDIVREAREAGAIDCIKKGTSFTDNLKFSKYIADLLRKI